MDKQFEQQIVDKINALILPENLDHAKILLQENAGSIDSIVIRLENNPWRNGVIKGDIIFARINLQGFIGIVKNCFKSFEKYKEFKVSKILSANNIKKFINNRILVKAFICFIIRSLNIIYELATAITVDSVPNTIIKERMLNTLSFISFGPFPALEFFITSLIKLNINF